MAFNISNFKTTMDAFGGPAKASLFEVRLFDSPEEQPPAQNPSGLPEFPITTRGRFTEREFSFFCKSAVVPGITLNTTQFEAVSQLPRQFPMTMANNPFSAVFMVDSDHQVLTFFHKWMQSVLNYGSTDPFAETNGKLPFEVGYKDDYSKTLSVRHYSTESNIEKYYEIIFYKAFPVALGDLDLAWENNDSYLTLPVTFAYDRIRFSGEQSETPKSRFSRGRNLLETLGAIGGFADVVQQTFKSGSPTSIQDAINRLTRVRNSFDNITRRRGI